MEIQKQSSNQGPTPSKTTLQPANVVANNPVVDAGEKRFYQRWWFWVLIGVIFVGGIFLFLF